MDSLVGLGLRVRLSNHPVVYKVGAVAPENLTTPARNLVTFDYLQQKTTTCPHSMLYVRATSAARGCQEYNFHERSSHYSPGNTY